MPVRTRVADQTAYNAAQIADLLVSVWRPRRDANGER